MNKNKGCVDYDRKAIKFIKKDMKEIIIIKTDHGEKIKNFLDQENFSYKVYQEPKSSSKIDIFANYGEAIKDKDREAELKA
jgi:hypothetical protein